MFRFYNINVEDTASHKNVAQNGRSMIKAFSEMAGNSVLIPSQDLTIFNETQKQALLKSFSYTLFVYVSTFMLGHVHVIELM